MGCCKGCSSVGIKTACITGPRKRKYEKRSDYWEDGIVETRKKRQRSQLTVSNEEPGPLDAVHEPGRRFQQTNFGTT